MIKHIIVSGFLVFIISTVLAVISQYFFVLYMKMHGSVVLANVIIDYVLPQYILSLTAFLNVFGLVRRKKYLIFLTFTLLPVLYTAFVLIEDLLLFNRLEFQFECISLLPFVFCTFVSSLIFCYRFRGYIDAKTETIN